MTRLDLDSIYPGMSRDQQIDQIFTRAREMADGGNNYEAGRLLQLFATDGAREPTKKEGRQAEAAWQAAMYYEAAGRAGQGWALAFMGESAVDRHTYLDYICKLCSQQVQTREVGLHWAQSADTLRTEFPNSARGWRWFLLWHLSVMVTNPANVEFVQTFAEPALVMDPDDHELRFRAVNYLRWIPGGGALASRLETEGMTRPGYIPACRELLGNVYDLRKEMTAAKNRNDYEAMFACGERILHLMPNEPLSLKNYMLAAAMSNRWFEARAAADQLGPMDEQAVHWGAVGAYKLGEYAQARERALRLHAFGTEAARQKATYLSKQINGNDPGGKPKLPF